MHTNASANASANTADPDSSQVHTLIESLQKVGLSSNESSKTLLDIHILGADNVEVASLKENDIVKKWGRLFDILSFDGIVQLYLVFIGPSLPLSKHQQSITFNHRTLAVTIQASHGYYHDYLEYGAIPDLIIAYNAGLWGYDSWQPTLSAIFRGWSESNTEKYLVITSYTLHESEDDYDTMHTIHSTLGIDQKLYWHWDCEENLNKCTAQVQRSCAKEDRSYFQNNYWQCVSLKKCSI